MARNGGKTGAYGLDNGGDGGALPALEASTRGG